MNKLVTLTSGLVLASTAAFAAQTTYDSDIGPYMGSAPVVGYISATVISTTAPVYAPLPSTSKTLNAVACTFRDTNNIANPRKWEVSGTNILVATATGMASGTLAVGDKIQCFVQYER